MKVTNRPISHVELNNTRTIQDLFDLLEKKPVNVLKERKMTLEERISQISLPENMYFTPSAYQLHKQRFELKRKAEMKKLELMFSKK